MRIILRTSIPGLGKVGDLVTVKEGFARNYLIPQGKAAVSTPENLKMFENQRTELELSEKKRLQDAQNRADALSEFTLSIKTPATSEGKLFGSVSIVEVVKLLQEKGQSISKNEVILDTVIRNVGVYTVYLQLHHEVKVSIPLNVEAS